MQQPQTPFEQPWERHRLRVPREDRTLFCRPDWEDAAAAVEDNQALLNGSTVNVQGRTLSHLREWTAREILQRAKEFTAAVRSDRQVRSDRLQPVPASNARPAEAGHYERGPAEAGHYERGPAEAGHYERGPAEAGHYEPGDDELSGFVVSGHQPSLFHPGVWVKNFAIDALARQTGRRSLNLIVDNDALSGTTLRVPTGTRENPSVTGIPFDESQAAKPWEEAGVRNLDLFRSFASRVTEVMQVWGVDPLLTGVWPDAVELAERGESLPVCLTAARHRLERRWGLDNLELPLSRLCETDPFLWFAGHLFAHAGRFRDVHNGALAQFRSINRVRSRTHPVPELSLVDDWTETPFWIWSASDSRRRRAFVRTRGRETELSDGRDIVARFPLSPDMDACCAVEALRELPRRGIRLRTRALTTTLFARLCLSDVFIHGIGGAKYDEMTDRIIARFHGLPAPEFLTMSATVHLPLAEPFGASPADVSRLEHQRRDLQFNPERTLRSQGFSALSQIETGPGSWSSLLEEKRSLILEQQSNRPAGLTRSQRRGRAADNARRFRRLREIGESLAAASDERRQLLDGEIAELQRQLAANAILRNREFSFSLYPESVLRPFLTGLF